MSSRGRAIVNSNGCEPNPPVGWIPIDTRYSFFEYRNFEDLCNIIKKFQLVSVSRKPREGEFFIR